MLSWRLLLGLNEMHTIEHLVPEYSEVGWAWSGVIGSDLSHLWAVSLAARLKENAELIRTHLLPDFDLQEISVL